MKSFVQEIPPSLFTGLYFLGRQPSTGSGSSHGLPVRASGADPNRTSKPESNDRYPGTLQNLLAAPLFLTGLHDQLNSVRIF